MISIKKLVDGSLCDHQIFDRTSARTIRQAIYYLVELRKKENLEMEVTYNYQSWIEIDGYVVPDSHLLAIDKEYQARIFLCSLRTHLQSCPSCGTHLN